MIYSIMGTDVIDFNELINNRLNSLKNYTEKQGEANHTKYFDSNDVVYCDKYVYEKWVGEKGEYSKTVYFFKDINITDLRNGDFEISHLDEQQKCYKFQKMKDGVIMEWIRN